MHASMHFLHVRTPLINVQGTCDQIPSPCRFFLLFTFDFEPPPLDFALALVAFGFLANEDASGRLWAREWDVSIGLKALTICECR